MPLTGREISEDPIGRYPHATVACFDPTRGELPRRRLDPERTVDYLERLAGFDAPGVLIASSTGQGHLRTPEELAEWFRCAGRARLGRTVPMGLLRPEDGMRANEHLLDLLVECDYPVVFFRPGTDLDPGAGAETVAASLRPLVAAAAERRLAVGLYSIPDVSGLPLTPAAAALLVDSPGGENIAAVKITEANYEASTARFLAHPALAKLKIVQGWDPFMVRALRDGPLHDADGRQRTGVTSGVMALALHQYLHILERATESDWDEVEAAQGAVTRVFESMQGDPARFADLQRAKYAMGLGQPLTGSVSDDQVTRIFEAMEAVPREADRGRLARSLDLMGDGPFHERLAALAG